MQDLKPFPETRQTDELLQHVAKMTQEKCELINDAIPIVQNALDYRIAATSETPVPSNS